MKIDSITTSNCWHDFEQSLNALSSHDKGRAFEELTRLHLKTDPLFSTKIIEVWHHSDIPQNVVDELGLQQPEIGVDLVAQVNDGTFWAIQCKFHQDESRNVSYDELSKHIAILYMRWENDEVKEELSFTEKIKNYISLMIKAL